MLLLHIGADHLGWLPLLLAVGVIIFIAATALRTKLERTSAEHKAREKQREAEHGDGRQSD